MSMVSLAADGAARVITLVGSGVFNPDSLADFNRALDEVLADGEAGLLVITGQDKNFSQGLDLEYLMSGSDGVMPFLGDCLRMIGRLLTFPIPVVAEVNGHAFGLGAMIVLASDYSVMREDRGFFCLPEIDMGATLTRRMNALVCGKLSGSVLRDILLTGRRIGGPEAVELSIVDRAVIHEQLRDAALEVARPMLGKNRQALAGLKRGINSDILAVIESDEAEATISGD